MYFPANLKAKNEPKQKCTRGKSEIGHNKKFEIE